MSDGNSRKPIISRDEWEKKMDEIHTSRESMDRLVLNYLVVEGYKDVALAFAKEAGMDIGVEVDNIGERMEVRHAVERGDIDGAASLVNDLNPEVWRYTIGSGDIRFGPKWRCLFSSLPCLTVRSAKEVLKKNWLSQSVWVYLPSMPAPLPTLADSGHAAGAVLPPPTAASN
jgi:LisH protein